MKYCKVVNIIANLIDLTGQTFGEWTVLKRLDESSRHRYSVWLCRCSCGVEKKVESSQLKSGRSKSCGHCPSRKGQVSLTHKEFIEEISSSNPHFGNIELLSEYKGSNEKIQCRCRICGYEYSTTPYLLRKHGCKKCADKLQGKKRRLSNDEFLKRMSQNIKTQSLSFMNEYQTGDTKMECKCNKCNRRFQTSAKNLLAGHGCPYVKNHEDYVHPAFKDLTNKRFGRLTVIERDTTKKCWNHVYWKCRCDCGNTTIVKSQHLREGTVRSCGCINSKMEFDVINELNNREVKYELHKTYDSLRGVGERPLSYDFYLPDKNILIECQGRQHYEPVQSFGGEKYFKIQQEHDRRKKQYADKNGITLIEIPYWKANEINDIFDKILQ